MNYKTNAKGSSDIKSLVSSNIDKGFDDSGINQLFALFTTKAEEKSLAKKAKKRNWPPMQKNEPNYLTKSSTIYILPNIDDYSFWTSMII